ncbi:MAG: hypothetical protein Q7K43_05985, partial [Candidatus Woesearchaeota archaeon]|nr:hypothetical protein [Candidatus Woesearchaeota archaeon]
LHFFIKRKMKKEVGVSVFAILIVLAAFLAVYYLNVRTTGFAVYQQDTQAAFDEGNYSNVVYDSNSSAVMLAANQTAGSYTSKFFDSGNNGTTWNNLTWQGADVTFEVRNCSTADCSDANFTTPSDLNNLSLSGQYFQYRITFDSSNDTLTSATINYTVPAAPVVTSVSILHPSGTRDSQTTIPLEYSAVGTGLQCWYNVKASDGSDVIANTTPSGCSNSEFDVSSDGDYVVTVYANGSSGFDSKSSTFLVSTTEEDDASEEEEEAPEETQVEVTEQQPIVTAIALGIVPNQEMIQGDSKQLTFAVQNSGTAALTSCKLDGDDSGFLAVSGEVKSIAPSATENFGFSVNVPDDALVAGYTLSLGVTCVEATTSTTFEVSVSEKKIDFNITNVQRTRDDRVSVDYTITELVGEDQDLEIYFSIKDAAGTELANASQNRSVGANDTDDFRTNIPINETLNGTMTLSVAFNSQIYSSSVLEPITLGAPTGAAILGGIGAGSLFIVIVVVLVLGAVFFVARRMRQRKKFSNILASDRDD